MTKSNRSCFVHTHALRQRERQSKERAYPMVPVVRHEHLDDMPKKTSQNQAKRIAHKHCRGNGTAPMSTPSNTLPLSSIKRVRRRTHVHIPKIAYSIPARDKNARNLALP